MSNKMNLHVGDVVMCNGYKVRVIDNRTNNGIGIVYLEGPKASWEDWIINLAQFSPVVAEEE